MAFVARGSPYNVEHHHCAIVAVAAIEDIDIILGVQGHADRAC